MSTDKALRIHNNISKATRYYGSDLWLINRREQTDTTRSSANALPKTTGPRDKQRIVDFRVKLNQVNIVRR